jgi:nucleoside-diphosphate-sugar epimerase
VSVDRLEAWGWRSTTSLASGLRKTYDYYLSSVSR